jgi:hypothetical protein
MGCCYDNICCIKCPIAIFQYYIPITKVEGWDGKVLWLKIKEDEVKSKYERQLVPDPSRYYVKDYPYHHTIIFPELKIISPPKYERPSRKATIIPPTDNQLSNHVAAVH